MGKNRRRENRLLQDPPDSGDTTGAEGDSGTDEYAARMQGGGKALDCKGNFEKAWLKILQKKRRKGTSLPFAWV
jgi:hypothetical protein